MKDSATRKNGFAKTCSFLAASLMAVCFLFVPVAEAKKYPDWVSVKYTGYSVRTQKGTNIKDPNHLIIALHFDITNNNKNGRVMTAIFDRDISWRGEIRSGIMPMPIQASFRIKGTNPYKGEWYPGQTYKYTTSVGFSGLSLIGNDGTSLRLSSGQWEYMNRGFVANNGSARFALKSFSLDFQVSSRN